MDAVAVAYRTHGSALVAARAINNDLRFGGHGPFRFDGCRTDRRFYDSHDVPYYRLTEIAIPQAISQWYLGSGGKVGSHTITGLAGLAELLRRRDAGELAFAVWPQEWVRLPRRPPRCGRELPGGLPADRGGRSLGRRRRARRATGRWIGRSPKPAKAACRRRSRSRPRPFGRIDGVTFEEQVSFEGWILGV